MRHLGVHLCSPRMGCTRSRHEPLICESDETEFLQRNRCGPGDNRIESSQSSNDWSVFNVKEYGTSNMGAGSTSSTSCPSHWWGSIPSLLGLVLLVLFLVTVFRRWQNKQRAKQLRRTMQQGLALQTVSAGIPQPLCPPDSQWRGVGGRFLT